MHRLKKIFHITLGIALIFVGIAGLILPILDGVVFLLLGFILLSFESPYIENRLSNLAHRYNVVGSWYDKLNAWMRRIFGS